MTEKELSKLNRYQLLELLMMLTKQNEELREENEALRKKQLHLDELGSVAEAALQLSGIFEAAQKAADDYLEEAKRRAEDIVARARMEAEIFHDTTNKT